MKGIGAGGYVYRIDFGPGYRIHFWQGDYINATIGFEGLSRVFDISSTSLMRMFGPNGNPQASNLFAVIYYLHEQEGIHLDVKAHKVIWGTV